MFPVAQEFKYLREKYDFYKAEKTCDKLGPEWRLPYKTNDELIDLYKNHSINAVWAGVVRKELPHWEWINGTKGIGLKPLEILINFKTDY